MIRNILFIAVLLLYPAIAHASCSIPPGEAGDIGFNTDSRVLQWCDGTDWYAAGQINPAGPNDGCLNPTGVGGDVIYNTDHNILQYCDGDHWQGIGGGVDMVPAGFSFADLLNQAQSSLVTSNIVSITDLGVAADVSISGDGSPQFRINGGSWVTSGTINDGDTLQLRLTTAATTGTANTATVVVGTIGAIWSASTAGADTVPNAFSFSDQTGVATSFLTSSNTITITGISSSTSVSVSGGGSPQISINGGAWTTSGSINNGQTLQVRLTASASNGVTLSATVDVGGVTDLWQVTTIAPSVTYVTQATNTANLSVYPFNSTSIGTASPDRLVVVVAGGLRNGATRTVSSITIGGVPATIALQNSNGSLGVVAIGYLAVASGTTANIVVTFAGGGEGSVDRAGIAVYNIKGISSTTPTDTMSVAGGGDLAGNIDVESSGIVVAGYYGSANTAVTWTGLTEDADISIETSDQISSASGYFTSAQTNMPVTVSLSGGSGQEMVGVAWQ